MALRPDWLIFSVIERCRHRRHPPDAAGPIAGRRRGLKASTLFVCRQPNGGGGVVQTAACSCCGLFSLLLSTPKHQQQTVHLMRHKASALVSAQHTKIDHSPATSEQIDQRAERPAASSRFNGVPLYLHPITLSPSLLRSPPRALSVCLLQWLFKCACRLRLSI